MLGKNVMDFNILKKLTQAYGPSGNEKKVAEIIIAELKEHADLIQTDVMGNLTVIKHGRTPGRGKKIMLAAHMDEVGVIVTHIDKNGYLYFSSVGGVRETELSGKRVVFGDGRSGIIARERKEKDDEASKARSFIDIGVTGEEEARKTVCEGAMAVFTGEYLETESHILSKALDDRAGCFVAMEVLKQYEGEHDLFAVFTVQEEVGSRGAKTAAWEIEPDLALIIDTTISYDTPGEKYRTALNKGAAIKIMDKSIIVSPKIKEWMADLAFKHHIDFQSEIISAGGTDSGPVHLTRGGIPTGGLAIPVRYLHTGNEIASKEDINSAFNLLSLLINNPLEVLRQQNI